MVPFLINLKNNKKKRINSQSMGDKVYGREGKNPDRKLRSLKCIKCERTVAQRGQLRSKLGSSYLLKSA